MCNRLLLLLVSLMFLPVLTQAQLPLRKVTIQLQGKDSFALQIPATHAISIAVQGLERPRFFAKSPDGRLFITDMHNRGDNKKGRVLILNNWNEKEHHFSDIITFMDSLHNPNQIAFYTQNGKNYLYVAETDKLTVLEYVNGSNKSSRNKRVVTRFPDHGLSYKYGGWHLTRSIAIHNNKLYVSVGSSCNACIEKESIRASIIEMNVNGSGQHLYATGLRNAVGMRWIGDQLWVTNMGRDGIGPDKPQDVLTPVKENGFYGWPWYYQYLQKIEADQQFKDSTGPHPLPPAAAGFCGFAAHTAPLGLCLLTGYADAAINNHILVALHGSTMVSRQRGNEVVMVTARDKYVPVVTGFLQGKTELLRYGRPCDVFQWDDHSFFISDDKNGIIYYVWKTSDDEHRPSR